MIRDHPRRPSEDNPDPDANVSEPDLGETTPAREFTRWLRRHTDEVARRWRGGIAQRADGLDAVSEALLARFLDLTLLLLPGCLGPLKAQFEPIFRRLAELYGSVGAMRGLAAGEVIEEWQLLRELLIRRVFAEPPEVGSPSLFLREILRLNRLVDRGVTYASVGHTDAMFFALFQGSGAPAQLDEHLLSEVEDQLQEIREDTDALLGLQTRNEEQGNSRRGRT